MPYPETSAWRAFSTLAPSVWPVSCLIASTSPSVPPAAPAWPTDNWPPEVLKGKLPLVSKVWRRMKSGPSPLAQKPRSSIWNHADDGIIVIGLDHIDVGGADACGFVEAVAVHHPAAAILHGIIRECVVTLDGTSQPRMRQPKASRALFAHDEECVGAGAGHHAIEQPKRVGDQPRAQILLERQRLLEQRVRKMQRIAALGDAELAKIFRQRAIGAHVIGGEEGKAGIGSACAIGIDRILREHAEARGALAKAVDMIGIAGDAGDDLGIAGLNRARRAAEADDAAAPPIGT